MSHQKQKPRDSAAFVRSSSVAKNRPRVQENAAGDFH
jgi:hypothetical protein